MKKTQKVMIGVTGTALLIGMTGCSSDYAEPNEKPDDPYCSDWDWDGEDAVGYVMMTILLIMVRISWGEVLQ